MASELVRQLVESGIHYGHRASRWEPKMKPYIFGKRNTIHIIDIRETVKGLLRAKKLVGQVVARGEDVLFVGTKRQARHSIEEHARRVGMPFVAERWLGGTLTNFRTIRSRLARLEELEREAADGTLQQYSKKMIASRTRELTKIKRNLDGIRNMTRPPGVMVVIDVNREHNAVKEARKMGIPTVCLIDTDSDPDFADVPIPGNDDSMRSIDMVIRILADAAAEGLKARAVQREDVPPADQPRQRPPRRMSERSDRAERTEPREAPAAPTPEDGAMASAGDKADG